MKTNDICQLAFRLVAILGIVNFVADFTYEGVRNIMSTLSAIIVGFMAGFGEVIGPKDLWSGFVSWVAA